MWPVRSQCRSDRSPHLCASVCICGSISSMTTDADLRLRYPGAFGASPMTRPLRWLGALLFVAWLVTLCIWFDITPDRLSRGMSGLFVILRQMFPPNPGAQWQDILRGLAESVAMAFLGTFTAALIAFPLG